MEKKWAVEVWGTVKNYHTELFWTEKEAKEHFKKIRKSLDSTKYIFSKESIVEVEDEDNGVYLTNLNEL